MRIATYHRVSTLDQHPDTAREALRGHAARLGGAVALEVEETGSGARNDRPGLQRVLEAARRGAIDTLLVWKLDRFGRSALDILGNLGVLETAGVRFVASTQGIDIKPGGDAMSRMLVTMLGAVSEFERGLISERTRLGLQRARRIGRRLGRPRKGLRPSGDDVLRLRADGKSWREVAQALGCTVASARRATAV